MRGAAFVVLGTLLLHTGCGRNRLGSRDGGAPEVGPELVPAAPDGAGDTWQPAASDGAREGGLERPAPDAEPDATALPDRPRPDARLADATGDPVGRDAAGPVDLAFPGCPPLHNSGLLNLGHIKQALFAADGHSLLVRIGGAETDANDEARLIGLPGGDSRVLGSGVRQVEWLGPAAALLTTADQLIAVSLTGEILLTLSLPPCSHAVAPDGSLIYFVSACDRDVGKLSVVDLASGSRKELAGNISPSSLTVSPDGRWAAYVVYAGDPAARMGSVHVADATGATYAVTGATPATRPVFASGGVLLYQSPGTAPGTSNIWSHDVGTGNSRSLGEGDVGVAGYELAADGSALLMARFPSNGVPGELYQVPLDGGTPLRLATDLMDYRMYSMAVRVFAFSLQSGRILYIADGSSDAGRCYDVASVASDGSGRVQLSDGNREAVVSPFADRIALIAVDRAQARSTITVTTTGGDRAISAEVNGEVSFASFVPRDRGLLVVTRTVGEVSGSLTELRHLSFATGTVTTLDWWQSTTLPLERYPLGLSFTRYPVDPQGCYLVVDSDYSQTASRLMAVPE